MNIFYLDQDPVVAANKQAMGSFVKMILESAQLLSTCCRHFGHDGTGIYKSAYYNHNSNIWTRKTKAHFLWLYQHSLALCERYTKTYGKVHKSQAIIETCGKFIQNIPAINPVLTWKAEDLAIKSTREGLRELEKFKASSQTNEDAVRAYSYFYAAKDYVVKETIGEIMSTDFEYVSGYPCSVNSILSLACSNLDIAKQISTAWDMFERKDTIKSDSRLWEVMTQICYLSKDLENRDYEGYFRSRNWICFHSSHEYFLGTDDKIYRSLTTNTVDKVTFTRYKLNDLGTVKSLREKQKAKMLVGKKLSYPKEVLEFILQ